MLTQVETARGSTTNVAAPYVSKHIEDVLQTRERHCGDTAANSPKRRETGLRIAAGRALFGYKMR